MTQRQCSACDHPVQDQHVVCRGCITRTRNKLSDQENLRQELLTALARDTRMTAPNDGGRSAEAPVPIDVRAQDLLHEQRNILVGWCRLIADQYGHHSLPPIAGPVCEDGALWTGAGEGRNCGHKSCQQIIIRRGPADTIAAMACHIEAWLDRLALHEAAGELVAEIRDLEQRILRAIDQPENRTRITVGPCIVELDDGSPCPGEVEAIIPRDEGKRPVMTCRYCKAEWHTEQWSRVGSFIMRKKRAPESARLREATFGPDDGAVA